MEVTDFKKRCNFDRAVLYYSAPKEIEEEPIVKSAIPQVETYNSNNRKYVCHTCKKRFFTKLALQNHIIAHSPNDPIDTNADHDNNSDWKSRYSQNKGIRCRRGECNFNALDTIEYSKHFKTCEGKRYTSDELNAFCESCNNYFSSDHHQRIHSILFHSINNPGITLADNDLEGDHLSEHLSVYLCKDDTRNENEVPLFKYRNSSKSDSNKLNSGISTCSLSDLSYKGNSSSLNGNVSGEPVENQDSIISCVLQSNVQDNTIDSITLDEDLNSSTPAVSLADSERGILKNRGNEAISRNIAEIVEKSITLDVLLEKFEFEVDHRENSDKNNVNEAECTVRNNEKLVIADSTITVVGETPQIHVIGNTPVAPENCQKTIELVNLDENNVNDNKSVVQEPVLTIVEFCPEKPQETDLITDLVRDLTNQSNGVFNNIVESEPIVFDASLTASYQIFKTPELTNSRGTSVEINADKVNDNIKIVVDPGVREPITINLSISDLSQFQSSVAHHENSKSEATKIKVSKIHPVVCLNRFQNPEKMSKVADNEELAGENSNEMSELDGNEKSTAGDVTNNHTGSLKSLSDVPIPNSDKTSGEMVDFEVDKNDASNIGDCSGAVSTESNDPSSSTMDESTPKDTTHSENSESISAEACSSETPDVSNFNEVLDDVSEKNTCDEISANNDKNTPTENTVSCDKIAEPCNSRESNSGEHSENGESSSSFVSDSRNTTSELNDVKKIGRQISLPEKRIRKIKKLADDFTLLMDSNPELRARIIPKDNRTFISKKKKDDQKNESKSSRNTPKSKPVEKMMSVEETKKKKKDRKKESKSPCVNSMVGEKISLEEGKRENASVESKDKRPPSVIAKNKNTPPDKSNEKKISLADLKKKNTTPVESSRKKASPDDSDEKRKRVWAKRALPVQENLMVSQRSVRQRKKLVLPDFDYGVEGKQDADDTDDEPKKFSYSVNETRVDPPHANVEKRGRPRKQSGIEKTPVENVNVSKLPKNVVRTKKEKQKKMEIDGEEFCLNSTINETDSFGKSEELAIEDQEEDDPQNELHSWLKQVDFSDQSPFDSWSPDEKSKAQKKMKSKLKKKKDASVVAKPAFLKKLLTKIKPNAEMKKSVPNENLSVPGKKKEKTIENVGVDTSKNVSPSNVTVSKKKPGRPKKSSENVASNQTQLHRNVTAVSNEKKMILSEVGTQTNVHMLKPPLEAKEMKRVPKKKLPFDPDTNISQNKTSPKKSLPPEDRVNLEPASAKRIPKRKIPFDPGAEPELKKKRIQKKKLTLEEQLEDPLKRRQMMICPCTSTQKKGDETNDERKSKKGRPRKNPIKSTQNLSPSVHIVTNQNQTFINEDEIKREIKFENLDNHLEMKKENIDLDSELQDLTAFNFSSALEMSDSTPNTTMEMPVVNENDATLRKNEVQVQSKPKKPRKKRSLLKRKDDSAENGNASDEMKKIDEDLYRSDVRIKSRYSKNFKKQPGPVKPQESMNDIVTCGRCKKKMTRTHYLTNHEISHYYLSWIEGEPEINLNDDNEMIRIMQSYISSDALRKKAIRLACEQCDKVMKSVIGYVSHVRFCQKTDEQELLETCTLCGKMLKPSSIRHHYVKYHCITKFTFGTDGRMLPDLSTVEISNKIVDSPLAPSMKNDRMGIERVPVQKADILRDDVFWTNLKTSYDLYMCMGLSCKHMTLSKDDLKTHILSCGSSFCEFSCVVCSFRTKYENEIIYHSKNKCKETSDVEDNDQPDKEETPMPTPTPTTPTAETNRRVSTRVRKRKYVIDYNDFEDDRHRKRQRKDKDDDFKFSELDTEDTDESNSDKDWDFLEASLGSRYSRKSLNKIAAEDAGLRQAFLSYCGNRPTDSLNWTVEVRLKTFSAGPVHEHLKVNMNEWKTFPISDSTKYTPMQRESPNVTFDRQSFSRYDLFQSAVVKGIPLCYTGGPVWSMAWAPLPAHIVEQYLAVASLQHMNQKLEVNSPVEFPSMVQIWKFSSIDNISNDIHKPTLAWAIGHSFGAVWSMEWCPTGGFDSTSKPVRLGILALGTSAGCVVIYNVPRLDCVEDNTGVVANPQPDLVLKVRSGNVQCTRIVWQRNYLPNIIFGGFSDGMIALWNVSTVSPILKKDKVIYPFRTFEAHTSAITALDVHWVDSGRFFLTGSIDRPIKYWDLEDLSGPMYEHEKSALVLSATWMHHWAVSAQGYDYFSQIEPSAIINHPREEKRKSILNINDCIWSVAYSDWNDAVAVSSNGGFVSVYGAKNLATLSYKSPDLDKIVTQTDLIPMNGNKKKVDENGKPTDDLYDYATITRDNAVLFDDRIKEIPDADRINFQADRNNILSINKVSWNNNYNNFNWLAVGYECGFVRVIRVERYDKHHLTKFYKMNENSSITLL